MTATNGICLTAGLQFFLNLCFTVIVKATICPVTVGTENCRQLSGSILWQIQQAIDLKLPYVYLGYYIEDSEKMSYKSKYQPIEGLINDHWQVIAEP